MTQIDRLFARNLARIPAVAVCGFLALSGIASAQPKQARVDRIVFGHLHVHPTSVDEHRKFTDFVPEVSFPTTTSLT